MPTPLQCPRRGRTVRGYAAALVFVVGMFFIPVSHAAPDPDEAFEEAFGFVDSFFGVFVDSATLRDQVNDGCDIRSVQVMYRLVDAQRRFNTRELTKAHRAAVRSWKTGDYVKEPKSVKRPFADDVKRLRRFVGDGTLTFTCFDFETGIGGAGAAPFYVVGRPRVCGKLGQRSYYFDEDSGYRFTDGCSGDAGPTSALLSDLLP